VVQAADPGWAAESLTLVVAGNRNRSRAENTRAAFDKQRIYATVEAHHHYAPLLKGKKRAEHTQSLVGFYPLEFDDDGKATDVAGQVSEPEGGHLWLQHLEDMKDDGDADQYVYNAEKLLGIAKDLWSEYPESVMDWSQVPDSSVVPTILKLIVKLPNNGSTSSFPPFSFPPGESADGGSGCKVTQRATRANASSTPARGGAAAEPQP
jgi:hypothetical protein